VGCDMRRGAGNMRIETKQNPTPSIATAPKRSGLITRTWMTRQKRTRNRALGQALTQIKSSACLNREERTKIRDGPYRCVVEKAV